MKRITIYPAPHVELRISASDEMMEDYKECARLAAEEGLDGKDCEGCSWDDAKIGCTNMCKLDGVHKAIIGG